MIVAELNRYFVVPTFFSQA